MGQERPLAIVVAYNNTEQMDEALASLEGSCEALVVDNGVDDDVRVVAERRGARYVTPGRNVGFAAAVNLGLREREGRDVLLLNPDARISPEAIFALRLALRDDPSLCAAAPILEERDGKRQRVEWPVPSPREEWVKAFRLQRLLQPKWTFLIGAVLLLRDEALIEIGPFDDRFFLYAEECDWQLRAQRAGWKVRVVEEARAIHAGGGSSRDEARRQRLFLESAELFGLKWYGRSGWSSMHAAGRVAAALRLVASLPSPIRRAHYARQLRL